MRSSMPISQLCTNKNVFTTQQHNFNLIHVFIPIIVRHINSSLPMYSTPISSDDLLAAAHLFLLHRVLLQFRIVQLAVEPVGFLAVVGQATDGNVADGVHEQGALHYDNVGLVVVAVGRLAVASVRRRRRRRWISRVYVMMIEGMRML